MTFKRALEEYRERFGDAYPLMCRKGMSESDMTAEILDCLSKGRQAETDSGVDY